MGRRSRSRCRLRPARRRRRPPGSNVSPGHPPRRPRSGRRVRQRRERQLLGLAAPRPARPVDAPWRTPASASPRRLTAMRIASRRAGGRRAGATRFAHSPPTSRPSGPSASTSADATITPSAPAFAIARTWPGLLTPNPTATGTGETALTSRTSLPDRGRQGGPGAGHPDQRDAIEEAAAPGGDRRRGEPAGSSGRRGRRQQARPRGRPPRTAHPRRASGRRRSVRPHPPRPVASPRPRRHRRR